jgi:hypothetical protein
VTGHGAAPAGPLFFVHVMKTGGSTFRQRMRRELGREAVFPYAPLDPPEAEPNLLVSYLAGLDPERLARIRGFAGHLPFFATELVPRPAHIVTILRNPVERTISFLKQHHRDRGLGPERSLESIYDLEWHRTLHMLNYQVRVFASTADEGIESVLHPLDIDERRMKIAEEHLGRVDVLGVTEEFDRFVAKAVERLGWNADLVVPNRRVSDHIEVPTSLRRKIAADNEADLAFYEHARQLIS